MVLMDPCVLLRLAHLNGRPATFSSGRETDKLDGSASRSNIVPQLARLQVSTRPRPVAP